MDKTCDTCWLFALENPSGEGFCEFHQEFKHASQGCEDWIKKGNSK